MIYYALLSFMVATFWFATAATEIARAEGWGRALARGFVVMAVWPLWVTMHVLLVVAVAFAFVVVRFVP